MKAFWQGESLLTATNGKLRDTLPYDSESVAYFAEGFERPV
jgi:hypothetical protein